MATYECSVCGMAVNATCAKCDAPLVDDILKLDDGTEVQISKCPNGHGKIKSPFLIQCVFRSAAKSTSVQWTPLLDRPSPLKSQTTHK